MSPEKQRIAIAEACGWKRPVPFQQCAGYPPSDVMISPTGSVEHINTVPRYLSGLNAMAEAEKVLTPEQKNEYIEELRGACWRPNLTGVWHNFNCHCAPPPNARKRS